MAINMEFNLSSKSDVLLAGMVAETSRVSADMAQTLVVWQTLVATEKKRDETHQHITSPCAGKVLNELKAECNALAKDLYSCYEKIRRDPWLSQLAPVQRIVETLIERLAKDYEEILAQELQQ